MKTEETEIALLKQEMQMVKEQNEKDHKGILSAIQGLKKDFCDFKDSADKKYASKTVEKIVYGMVALVLSSVVMAILGLVILEAK